MMEVVGQAGYLTRGTRRRCWPDGWECTPAAWSSSPSVGAPTRSSATLIAIFGLGLPRSCDKRTEERNHGFSPTTKHKKRSGSWPIGSSPICPPMSGCASSRPTPTTTGSTASSGRTGLLRPVGLRSAEDVAEPGSGSRDIADGGGGPAALLLCAGDRDAGYRGRGHRPVRVGSPATAVAPGVIAGDTVVTTALVELLGSPWPRRCEPSGAGDGGR